MGSRKEDKELMAIDRILDAFNDVADNRKQHVLEYVRERLNITEQQPPAATPYGSKPQLQNKSLSIDAFIRDKKPSTDYQRIAALGYYMQNNEQKVEFNRKDLVNANTRARQTRFTNISQAVLDAKHKYGYVSEGPTNGMLQLTTAGEDVVNALPDQAAAKLVKKPKKLKRKKSKKLKKATR